MAGGGGSIGCRQPVAAASTSRRRSEHVHLRDAHLLPEHQHRGDDHIDGVRQTDRHRRFDYARHVLGPERRFVRAEVVHLSSFIGQSVTLTFTGVEDSSLQTSFLIDDTSLAVS